MYVQLVCGMVHKEFYRRQISVILTYDAELPCSLTSDQKSQQRYNLKKSSFFSSVALF